MCRDISVGNTDGNPNGTFVYIYTLFVQFGAFSSESAAQTQVANVKNKFEKLEDIMNVSGIGESAYSKIKDLFSRNTD